MEGGGAAVAGNSLAAKGLAGVLAEQRAETAAEAPSFEALLARVLAYNPGADTGLLRRAYKLAEWAHGHQRRISGEAYITHPLAVALILAELGLDLETLVAGLLHDVVEDTEVSLEDITREFGPEVAQLVDGVTKLKRLAKEDREGLRAEQDDRSREEHQAENLRKMFLAMARDIRVILIKLADRLHNMRTLWHHPEHKQQEIARETLEIFAPLAHRLGIYRLKWELEDLAFRYLDPRAYYEVAQKLATTRRRREEYLHSVAADLAARLAAMGINADIQTRPKNLYSIYNKMQRQQKDLHEIYDCLAMRILVDTVRDCYAVLGVVHATWKPIPGRFKDFIAMPKSNMYQSLHTTVVGPEGEPLEIQIRTWEMHRTAEYGIAAHWRYKEGTRGDRAFDQKLAWLRQILEWSRDLKDAREFMESLKIDLFSDTVFVFTPRGDVVELPAGSVPVDFAYRIHTDIGHRCVGARVNGRLVPLDYQLKNGDIVEIITSKQGKPSRDWLAIVKTSQARNRIRQWFRREQREEHMARGREALEREAKKQGLPPDLLKAERLAEVARRFNLNTAEDLYAALGDGAVTTGAVLGRLRELCGAKETERAEDTVPPRPPATPGRPAPGIRIRGVDNVLVRLAHCCNPVPGDPITGYVTRGRGVSIHRSECRNIGVWRETERERLVEASWDEGFGGPFRVRLVVEAVDRAGLLSDVMAVLADQRLSASWVTARGRRDQMASIEVTVEINSLEQLNHVIQRVGRVRDVLSVRRAGVH
jgi:GTP pyrophosphokinase